MNEPNRYVMAESAADKESRRLELGKQYFGRPGTHLTTMSLVAVAGRRPA